MAALRTERLLLQPWSLTEAHVAGAFSLWSAPEAERMLAGPITTRAEARDRLEALIARRARGEQHAWAIELRAEAGVVGAIGLTRFQPGPVFELSFQVTSAQAGRGLATEAGLSVVRHAFEALGASKLVAGTLGDNPGSDRVLGKLGFVRRGHILWPDNQQWDPYYERLPDAGGCTS